jgi:glycerol 3-phosphatase-1
MNSVTAKWQPESNTFRIRIEQPVGRQTPAATPDVTPAQTPAMSRSNSVSSASGRSRFISKGSDELTGADSVFGSPANSRPGSPDQADQEGSGLQRKSSTRQAPANQVPGGVTLEGFKKALGANARKQRKSDDADAQDDEI